MSPPTAPDSSTSTPQADPIRRNPNLQSKTTPKPQLQASVVTAEDLAQLIKPQQPSSSSGLLNQIPHLFDPKVIATMTCAFSDVSQTLSVLNALGDCPDHEAFDTAKAKLAHNKPTPSKKLEGLVLSPRPSEVDHFQWWAHLAEREQEYRYSAEKEKRDCRAIRSPARGKETGKDQL